MAESCTVEGAQNSIGMIVVDRNLRVILVGLQ